MHDCFGSPFEATLIVELLLTSMLDKHLFVSFFFFQRIADERTAKATDLEQKVALLEVRCKEVKLFLFEYEGRFSITI
jgi:hypothetical protein